MAIAVPALTSIWKPDWIKNPTQPLEALLPLLKGARVDTLAPDGFEWVLKTKDGYFVRFHGSDGPCGPVISPNLGRAFRVSSLGCLLSIYCFLLQEIPRSKICEEKFFAEMVPAQTLIRRRK
jgi:hypothetical protein